MIDLGLSPAGLRALLATLASPHQIDVSVSILDMDHRPVGKLAGRITGGQVNIDSQAEVTRQLQLTFVDEDKTVRVDTQDGRPEMRRMVQVVYRVKVIEVIEDWVSIPIFTGPITNVDRDGELVTLEARGKEHLCLSPVWRSRTYPQGSNRIALTRTILADLTGETRFSFPKGWTHRTSKIVALTKAEPAWAQCKIITNGIRAQLFYDGRGTARIRRRPVRTTFTFKDGDGGMLLSSPKVAESSEDLVNLVRVVGAVPTGKKNPLVAEEPLPRSHPHSPGAMARNGVANYFPEEIEDDALRTQAEVDATAKRRVQEIQLDEQMVTFDCLPMPLLEEGDPFVVDAKDAKVTARMSQMTIPLTHDGRSNIGYIAPASRRKR